VSFAGIDRGASFCFSIRNEANLKDGEPMSVQLAILYTALPSSRKIVRVHNIQLHTSTDPVVIFRHADADCMVTYLCKMAAAHALRNPMSLEKASSKAYTLGGSRRTSDIRQRVIDICVDILLNYRQLCSSHSPKGQLILPESLKVLPLYTLCMLKHPCFMQNAVVGGATAASGGSTRLAVDACERSFVLNTMLRATFKETMHSLYPRMYPLHDLDDDDGYPIDDSDGFAPRKGGGRSHSFEDDDYSASGSEEVSVFEH
jgi:protein transport protein SEC24